MRIQPKQLMPMLLILSVGAVFAFGCSTSSRKSTGRTEASIATLEDRMELAKAQVDAVVLGLQALDGKQGKDLEKAYSIFKKEVSQVEKMGASIRSRVDAMKKQGAAHFAAWEKNMEALDDEELRQMSAARKAQLGAKYQGLAKALETTSTEGREFIDGLHNIVKFLELDLTPATVGSLGNRVTTTEQDAAQLKQALDGVMTELGKLAAEMGTGGSASK